MTILAVLAVLAVAAGAVGARELWRKLKPRKK